MSGLSPALDADLRRDRPLVFGAVAIDLPGHGLSLLDAAGRVTVDGRVFTGRDPTFGVLADIEDLTDGMGDSAPALSIGLLPSGDAQAAALAAPDMQGSRVTILFGTVDPATGLAIGSEVVFVGELDVPVLHSTEHGRRLDYEVVSVFERLFEGDESARLSPGHHRSIFPGEAGMDFVTGVEQPVPWGVIGAPSPVVAGAGGNVYGGGGQAVEQ